MKKRSALLLLIVCMLVLSSCVGATGPSPSPGEPTESVAVPPEPPSPSPPSPSPPESKQLSVADLFPIRDNCRYVYEGSGNEFASYVAYADYTTDSKVQQRVNNGGTETVKVYTIGDGKLRLIFAQEETYYRENFLEKAGDREEILLMEPIEEGNTWTLADSRVRTITDTNAEVTTPSGTYSAVEVTTEGSEYKSKDYYAEGVGLVKSVFYSGDSEISSSLKEIEEGVSWKQLVRFYYPNADAEGVEYVEAELEFNTNDVTRKVLEAAYKSAVPEQSKVFSENTAINSLYLNKDGMVYLDLNQAFVSEMNAGSSYESLILRSVANTFCRYYSVDRMILTVDNKPYESGHLVFQKGEYLTADYED